MLVNKTDTFTPLIFMFFLFFFTVELVARQTLNVSVIHQARLHGLISEGCKIIGYVRKSPGKKSSTTRLRLLESMVDKWMKASSVDMVLNSYSSASDEPFVKRDTTTTAVIPRTTGNTQGNTAKYYRSLNVTKRQSSEM